MTPDEAMAMDAEVFGSFGDARWHEVGATVDALADVAAKHLSGGLTPGQAAMAMEYVLERQGDNGDGRALAAFCNAAVQLALTRLPQPSAGGPPR